MKIQINCYALLLATLLLITLCGCGQNTQDKTPAGPSTPIDPNGRPSFAGTVTEVMDDYIAVKVTQSNGVSLGDTFHVSRSMQGKGNIGTYRVGDQVQVIFDGKVAASFPGKILTVFDILMLTP